MKKTWAILAAGLAAATADILAAFIIFRPATPQQILQSVASGWFGHAAFDGGWPMAAAGLGLHALISILFAAMFVTLAGWAPVMLRRPTPAGVFSGVFVYGVMNAIVVPLSMAASRAPPPAHTLLLGLVANILFGLAMSHVAARVLRTPKV